MSRTTVSRVRKHWAWVLPVCGLAVTISASVSLAASGNGPGTASGLKFEDRNGNAVRDGDELTLRGWTIFADDNMDGVLDADEIGTVSAIDGAYALHGLDVGSHVVRELARCGYQQTLPVANGTYTAEIVGEASMVSDLNFGNQPPSVLPGDSNGDGKVSAADIIEVFKVANADGSVDAGDLETTWSNLFDCSGFTIVPQVSTPTVTSLPTETVSPSPTGNETPSPTAEVTSPTPSVTPEESPTPSGTPSESTPSPTPEVQTITPSVTSTVTPPMSGVGETLASGSVLVAQGMDVVSAMLTSIIAGSQSSSSAAAVGDAPGVGELADACITKMCNGTMQTITLAGCTRPTSTGSVTLVGTVSLQGSLFCPGLPPYTVTANVEATFKDQNQQVKQIATAHVAGTATVVTGGSCFVTSADLTLTGTLTSNFPGIATVTLGLTSTQVGVAVAKFPPTGCVPQDYSITFNGPATIQESFGNTAAVDMIDVDFENFTLAQKGSVSPAESRLDGVMTSMCFGGKVTLETLTPLTPVFGEPCPSAGVIRVRPEMGAETHILYLPDGKVGIDSDLDGMSDANYQSCLDPALLVCVGSHPTPTGTSTETPTEISTETPTEVVTDTPSETPTETPTEFAGGETPTATAIVPVPSPSPTSPELQTPTPSVTVTGTPSPTVTATVEGLPSPTPTPSDTPATETPTATPSPSATVEGGVAAIYCDTLPGPASIPDDDPTGLSNAITVPGSNKIGDLNVRVTVEHTYVGDLLITLTHLDTAVTATLIDQPGFPQSTAGCEGDDIACTLDDEAAPAVEDECGAGVPAINGRFRPNTPLSAFAGEDAAGTWRLTVSDLQPADQGALLGWCLEVNQPQAPAPTTTPTGLATGDCCAGHDGAGCERLTCEQCVCGPDLNDVCCVSGWDEICAAKASGSCAEACQCQPPPPPTGDCCSAHDGAGCELAACEDCVCGANLELDAFCCTIGPGFGWDDTCAGEAAAAGCAAACGCGQPVSLSAGQPVSWSGLSARETWGWRGPRSALRLTS